MQCEIVIVAESNEGELDPITLDLIACGSPVAQEKNWAIGVLVLGCGLDPLIRQLSGKGVVDHLFAVDDPRFERYNASVHVDAVANAIREIKPKLILAAHSYIGIEITAALAPLLNASLIANCHSIEAAENGFLVTRSMFAGKFVATIAVADTDLVLATMSRESSVVRSVATRNCQLHRLPLPAYGEARIEVVSTREPSRTEDITKAEIVVAIGRAISHESQIESFRQLASGLGGVITASRPIVDLGWLDSDHQVGLSGVTVKPKVYLALGISGSAQHVVGMNQSRLIIAINKDASAPIFQFAHCGAVADVFEILPLLLEKSKTRNLDRGAGPA